MATTRPSRSRSPRVAPSQRFRYLVAKPARDLQRRPEQILRHIGLVGKINSRLHERQRFDQPRPPCLGAVAEQALELPIRLPALRFGLGANQIGQTLDGGEVEPAVLEGAARKLAGLCRPQSVDAAECAEHRGNDRAPSVHLQFGDVLAGLTAGAWKPQRQRFVEHFAAGGIADPGEGGLARLRHAACEGLQCMAGARARDSNNRDGRRRAAGGKRENSIADGAGHSRAPKRHALPVVKSPVERVDRNRAINSWTSIRMSIDERPAIPPAR